MTIVYVSIGNSDDKLTQAEWAEFVQAVRNMAAAYPKAVHGEWFSAPHSPYQNACWCLEFDNEADMCEARESLKIQREHYQQDSVAWAVAETEFL